MHRVWPVLTVLLLVGVFVSPALADDDEPLTGEAQVQLSKASVYPEAKAEKPFVSLPWKAKVFITGAPQGGYYPIAVNRIKSDNTDPKISAAIRVRKGTDLSKMTTGWIQKSALLSPEEFKLKETNSGTTASMGGQVAAAKGFDSEKRQSDLKNLNNKKHKAESVNRKQFRVTRKQRKVAEAKGFNEVTEAQHRQNANLEWAYDTLDIIETTPGYRTDEFELDDKLADFRRKGKLGEYTGQ